MRFKAVFILLFITIIVFFSDFGRDCLLVKGYIRNGTKFDLHFFRCARISIGGPVRRLVGRSVCWSKLMKNELLRILNDLESA